MGWLLKHKVDLFFLTNPFYVFCLSFTLAIIVYLWGWSDIFPKLSVNLLVFFGISFIVFITFGYKYHTKGFNYNLNQLFPYFMNEIVFWLIILLGFINILYMGYMPFLRYDPHYREFGAPVIDPIFNTLSIFFSVFYLQTFLNSKKKKYLLYIFSILILQILIFRRSTVVWILLSSLFMLIYHYRRISLISILFLLALIPFLSYSFGVYGNYRSNLSKSFVIDDLGASESFKKSGMSHNQYISYLYVSSPLANLQTNINESKGFFNNRNLHSFIFYCVIPQSITLRAQKKLNLTAPSPSLISSELLVGTFLMVGFITMGWGGMILMLLLALIAICLCLYVTKRWNVFQVTTLCILESTVCLLIFSNFLNRLDVILMVFIYPVFFHLIFEKARIRESLVK